jgi:riboflavin kinase / FMN adenylyltransferase
LQWKGMMSIGVRPTVGGTDRTIEVNIFNFSEDIYGEKIRVYVKVFIRPEAKFSGLDELRRAIEQDKIAAEGILNQQA